jgi:hypothetical protein
MTNKELQHEMKEQITVDKEEYDSLVGCYEDLKLLDREHKKLQEEYKELERLTADTKKKIMEPLRKAILLINSLESLDK